jgi:hypothetical protein
VRITSEARADILWWDCFVQGWNGLSFMAPSSPSDSIQVFSDAAGSYGCGAFLPSGDWLQVQWPTDWDSPSIAVMELIPIVIAAGMWGAAWQGQRVHFHCDNASMVSILNRRYSSETTLANLLRCLVFFAVYFSFHLSAKHILAR